MNYEQINRVAKKLFWKNKGRGYSETMSKIKAAIVKGWLLERYGHVKVEHVKRGPYEPINNICKDCDGTGVWPNGGFENGQLCDNVCPGCLGSGRKK